MVSIFFFSYINQKRVRQCDKPRVQREIERFFCVSLKTTLALHVILFSIDKYRTRFKSYPNIQSNKREKKSEYYAEHISFKFLSSEYVNPKAGNKRIQFFKCMFILLVVAVSV